MNVPVCEGNITLDMSGALQCSSGWDIALYASTQSFDPSTLDPVLIAGAIGAGFFVCLPIWAAAHGAVLLLKMIR